jgi:spore maturation protein SpmA
MNNKEDAATMIAESIRYAANVLGTGNAATSMGAIELLAKETLAGSERIAAALSAIADSLEGVANAIRDSV